jgi:hypothetical protein
MTVTRQVNINLCERLPTLLQGLVCAPRLAENKASSRQTGLGRREENVCGSKRAFVDISVRGEARVMAIHFASTLIITARIGFDVR